MTITAESSTVEDYVSRCAPFLGDLTPELRSQFQEDIRQIVGEVTTELDGRPDDLVGPPERFVAELRRAAGIDPSEPAESPQSAPAPGRAAGDAVLQWLTRAVLPWLRQLAMDLRPAWWVARGIGLGLVVGSVTGSAAVGALAAAGFVFLSVERGRSRRRSSRRRMLFWVVAGLASVIGLSTAVGDLREPAFEFDGFAQPIGVDVGQPQEMLAPVGPRNLSIYMGNQPEPFAAGMSSPADASAALVELRARGFAAEELRLELYDGSGGQFHESHTYSELEAAIRRFFGLAQHLEG